MSLPRLALPLAASLIATALVAGPAAADDGAHRRVEVGGLLGLAYFGDDIELGNSWAAEQIPGTSLLAGARGTFIVLPDLAASSSLDPQLGVEAEVDLAFASTREASEGGRPSYFTPVLGWRVHAIARLRTGGVLTPHLVVGGGGESVFTSSPFMVDDTDPAFHWGPGVSWALTDRLVGRVDLRHDLTAGRIDGVVSTVAVQFGLAAGWDLTPGRERARAPADRDHDGIADRDDRCPTEAETVNDFEDDDGCPDTADRDRDGIADADDACPEEPELVNGLEDDDGCPEIDQDGDGLIGPQDACPTEAEDFDKHDDGDGCPDRDNDGDSKPDVSDVCPDQPETYNGFDDEDGCPDELPRAVKEYTGAIAGITFEYGRARIQAAAKPPLTKAAAILREFASIRIRIEGHTDDRGSRERNLALSHKRAEAVKWFLVDQGIAADRIETLGHGPDLPLQPNKTSKGRAANRRIEFHILFQDPSQNVAPQDPSTQPSAPATQPSEPSTQPSAPSTQPTEPAPAPAPSPQPTEPAPAPAPSTQPTEPAPSEPAGELR